MPERQPAVLIPGKTFLPASPRPRIDLISFYEFFMVDNHYSLSQSTDNPSPRGAKLQEIITPSPREAHRFNPLRPKRGA
jgi:hypothetical protein